MASEEMVAIVTFSASHGPIAGRWSHARHASAAVAGAALLLTVPATAQHKEHAMHDRAAGETASGVANLPYARGKTFSSLDEYLAHLEAQGALDLPWWREIRPGVYQRMTSMPEARPEVATREELARRFGFAR